MNDCFLYANQLKRRTVTVGEKGYELWPDAQGRLKWDCLGLEDRALSSRLSEEGGE